jgi:TRAP-type C4-dicarboxylate transport system substrate-binding protein
MDEATRWQVDFIAKKDAELLETLKKAGMQVTEPDKDAFRKATAPAYEAFYARFGQDARDFVQAVGRL